MNSDQNFDFCRLHIQFPIDSEIIHYQHMLIKPAAVATACSNCGVEDQLLLHNVRHHGIFRRLCTTCVLRLHPHSFCPTCFQVYPPPPSNGAVLTCFKCYSSTHSHCVAAGPASPPSPYICALCVDANIPIFKLKTAKEPDLESLSVESEEYCRVMDRDAAAKLLAAAKIVSASMSEAAVAAKAEAERTAKEAAFARKRAKEALDYVAYLVMKEKLRKKEEALRASGKLEGSGLGGVGGNAVYANGVFRENNANVCPNRNGFMSPGIVEEKINTIQSVNEADNSKQVLAALDAVELRENKIIGGITAECATSRVTTYDDQVVMNVDEKRRMMANAAENIGGLIAELNDVSGVDQMIFSDEEIGSENLNLQGEKQE